MFSVKEILIGCESMRFLFCERTTSGMRERRGDRLNFEAFILLVHHVHGSGQLAEIRNTMIAAERRSAQ